MSAPILRLWLFGFAFMALGTLNPSSGLAQDEAASVPEAPTPATSSARSDAPSMIVDPDTNSFRFIIDGKEVARIDQKGLHVRDDVTYGGSITDGGSAAFDEKAASRDGAQ